MNREDEGNRAKLGLYLHLPFCIRKCLYCDFLSGPANETRMKEYTDALCKEIIGYRMLAKEYLVDTIFVGGGTPSILPKACMEQIFHTLQLCFSLEPDAEITVELNPGTINRNKLICYRHLGVNRLSIGLQSANDEELRLLGRIHCYDDFLTSFHLARECGFMNINIDLMSALPMQTVKSYKTTLDQVKALNPEHISAYSLIVEEGTPFAALYENQETLPDEDSEREMYELTEKVLSASGYSRYEISNYAKQGYACRHNLRYWTRKEYLGLGLGASSFLKFNGRQERWHNVEDMEIYLKEAANIHRLRMEIQVLDGKQQMEEFMFLGLRLKQGVSKLLFKQEFGISMALVYGEVIPALIRKGLVYEKGDYLCLTKRGVDISNYVFSEFLL